LIPVYGGDGKHARTLINRAIFAVDDTSIGSSVYVSSDVPSVA
jgi:hypothetical protein